MTSIFSLSELEKYGLEDFLLSNPQNLIYTSPKYIRLIENLTESSNRIIGVVEGNQIQGIFPFLEKRGEPGLVVNSFPYYGSHGGIIAEQAEIQQALLDSFMQYCTENAVLSATVIPSFFRDRESFYAEHFKPDYTAERIGQYTPLKGDISPGIEEMLMNKFHFKTRNMVRKALKSDISTDATPSDEAFEYLVGTHVENCREINIKPKSLSFFEQLRTTFTANTDYKLFTARHSGKMIAALLCLYYNRTVEYFVPVITKDYRNLQPLSCLIYAGMIDAARNGYEYWNWGGTSRSAEGVYLFKSRWGTIDQVYHYYTRVFNKSVFNLSIDHINQYYPNFFVLPFSILEPKSSPSA